MALRKALVTSSVIQDNAASFVNVTSDRLHIRKLVLTGLPESTAPAPGDAQICSIDEVPAGQAQLNDSRSHIMAGVQTVAGGVIAAAVHNMGPSAIILTFNRNDLVLDPDEAVFMNILNVIGSLEVTWSLNIWYED